jgi:predicted nucleic acid-binding protein
VLLDTGVLLALAFPQDTNHQKARVAMRGVTGERIIGAPVLPELFYMMVERMAYRDAVKFFRALQGKAFRIEPLTADDMARMTDTKFG